MAYTHIQLQTVEDAIASGTLRVEIDGRVVVYQSLDALMKLRDQIKAELGVTTPSAARGRAWRPIASDGL
ncbi:MAG: phage head-tail joining protein [Chitinophagaceae bacterium]